MNLLHVCSITNNKTSGISNVVPEHFINQSKFVKVALLNCNNTQIERLKSEKNVFYYNEINKNIDNLPKPFNCPDLVVFHGIYISQYISIYKKILKKVFGNLVLFNRFIKKAKAIQYLSEIEQKMSSDFKNDSFIMGNGIYTPSLKKEKFSENCIKLVYVGRYAVYHKGLDILLDGCKKAYKNMIINKIEVNLYGAGNEGENHIREMIKKRNLERVVKAHGPVFDNQKIAEIIKNDIFIQTSRLEGQPLGIMEAMALGMPVIVSEGTTFGSIVQSNECGLVCSTPDEVSTILNELKKESKHFLKFGKNSRKYIENNLTWNTIASKSVKKYKELIKDAR